MARTRPGREVIHYSEELALKICDLLIGGDSLRTICADPAMPVMSTVLKWLHEHPEFSTWYDRARELQAEAMGEEILVISDDGTNDTYEDKDGNKRTDYDNIHRSKLRVDTRKWLMAHMHARRYGNKQFVETKIVSPEAALNDLDSDPSGT